jgi:hypothetical protein
MMLKMYELEIYENESGGITLKQQEFYTEDSIILLSKEQIPLVIRHLQSLIEEGGDNETR